jgi:hypothetical protein
MRYNGLWRNGSERIAVFRTSQEDGTILFRVVDESGKRLSGVQKEYPEEKLIGFIKEGSNERYKVC